MDTRTSRAGESGRISTRQLAIFAAAGLPVGGYVATLAVYLPNYYTAGLHLSLLSVGIAFTVVRILDIVLDPALGVVMDRTATKMGRFRPWLAASIPVLMAATYATYLARPGIGPIYLAVWLLILYAGYSMCVLSHAGWGTSLVAEYHERNRVYGWIQAVGVIGAASVLLLPLGLIQGLHVKIGSISLMGLFFMIAVPVTFLVTVLFAPEPQRSRHHMPQNIRVGDLLALIARPDMARNLVATLLTTFGPAITAPLYLFFFQKARGYLPWQTTVLLIIYILAGLIGPAFWTRVAARVGKQQTVKIASIAYAIAQTGLLLLPRAHVIEMSFAMFTVGFVASAFAFLLRAMVADICDEVRLETGADRTALIYGLATSTAKFASTVSVGVAYPVLAFFGFKTAEGAINTATAMWGLQALYLIPPVACVLLGGLAMLGYRMNEQRHNEIRQALHTRAQATAGQADADIQPASVSQLQPGE